MRRGDQIGLRQVNADASGDRLLADRQMDRALDVAVFQRLLGGLLEGADARHHAVMAEHALAIEIRWPGHRDDSPAQIRPAAYPPSSKTE